MVVWFSVRVGANISVLETSAHLLILLQSRLSLFLNSLLFCVPGTGFLLLLEFYCWFCMYFVPILFVLCTTRVYHGIVSIKFHNQRYSKLPAQAIHKINKQIRHEQHIIINQNKLSSIKDYANCKRLQYGYLNLVYVHK